MSKPVTEKDLRRLIEEESAKFLKENQDEIVRRAWRRLQEMKSKGSDAPLP